MITTTDSRFDLSELIRSYPEPKRVILHVHRNPSTGVLTMMKELVREQMRIPGVLAILAVPADSIWINSSYGVETRALDIPVIIAQVPHWRRFGTGAFLSFVVTNPVRQWLQELRRLLPNAEIVLHSHSAWLTGAYFPLVVAPPLAIICTFHGIADENRLYKYTWLRMIHRWFAQRAYRSGAALTSVAGATLPIAEALFKVPSTAFTVIPNGIHSKACMRSDAQDRGHADFVLGYVGQLHPGKGWKLVVQACDELRQAGRRVRLILAGKGQDEEAVRSDAASRSDYVEFLGLVPNAFEVLLPRLDAIVLPSWTEGMPMIIVEAMAAGVPTLATPVGAIPEMIENGVNGLIIDRSVSSIVAAVSRLLDNKELHMAMSASARNTYIKKYTIERIAQQYSMLYTNELLRSAQG